MYLTLHSSVIYCVLVYFYIQNAISNQLRNDQGFPLLNCSIAECCTQHVSDLSLRSYHKNGPKMDMILYKLHAVQNRLHEGTYIHDVLYDMKYNIVEEL